MFCPKCGQQNPETGKFCRACGTDLGNVANAMSGSMPVQAPAQPLVDRKGKPVSWESAMGKLFMGIAFFVVSVVSVVSGKGGGWWYWMLIPGFMFFGMGIAQWVMLKKAEKGLPVSLPNSQPVIAPSQISALPSAEQQWAPTESSYKTGDLVPPSVTDPTTRHLELDSEGKTMTLPKK